MNAVITAMCKLTSHFLVEIIRFNSQKLMALMVSVCMMLILSACSVLTVRAECTRDCALCLYSSMSPQPEDSSTGPCTLECGSSVDLRKLGLCRNALSEDERAAVDKNEEASNIKHLLIRKYGGFMKRYGGFMMKKSPEDLTNNNFQSVSEEKLDILRDALRMGLDANTQGKDLQKRYGGFMRRVGRPQWHDEPNPYGLRKRWEDKEADNVLPETQKRYGGFMD
ncbi:Proenkephalin-A [Bagarius yarrelli]|uniref:Proenkephalin-A n=1 Tax=Bagarius yarrelli TaxID=175774 RepID=A0A556V3W8_BAGYA|nr:Proenkephalin-A [Bagarius yarrelli]